MVHNAKLLITKESFEITVLDNGLRVITCEMPEVQSASINLIVGVGSRHETDQYAGVSHFLEHIFFKGTNKRPTPKLISGAIEGVGGVINAETEQELTNYWCKVPANYVYDAIDLLLDMIRNSLINENEIDKERAVILDELAMTHDLPEYQVDTLIDGMLWPGHPLSRDIGGTKETVFNINREILKEHIEKYYSPLNTVISVAGNINHQQIVSQIELLTSNWVGDSPPDYLSYSNHQDAPKSKIKFRSTEQAYLSIAFPAISIFHDDRDALGLLNVAIGEGMSSRLFIELRENQGLAYDIHSSLVYFKDCGAFTVKAGVEPKRIYDATQLIMEQLEDIKNAIEFEEFSKAKQMAAGRLILLMEDSRAVSNWFGIQEILLNEIIDPATAIFKLNSLDPDDVNRVSKTVLEFVNLNIAVVGPCRGSKRLGQLITEWI